MNKPIELRKAILSIFSKMIGCVHDALFSFTFSNWRITPKLKNISQWSGASQDLTAKKAKSTKKHRRMDYNS